MMINQHTTPFLLIFLGISALALTACSTTQSTKEQVVYHCDRGTTLNVTFVERSYSTIHGGRHSKVRHHKRATAAIVYISENQTVTLPAEKVASGFMYSNGRYTLRGKESEAIWSIGKMADEHCVAD
jgi:membrane-bound inhibitor of C-type lysozyme